MEIMNKQKNKLFHEKLLCIDPSHHYQQQQKKKEYQHQLYSYEPFPAI